MSSATISDTPLWRNKHALVGVLSVAGGSVLLSAVSYLFYCRYNWREFALLNDYTPSEGHRRNDLWKNANSELRIRVVNLDGCLKKQTELFERYGPTVLEMEAWGPSLRLDTSFRLMWKFDDELTRITGVSHDDDAQNRPLVFRSLQALVTFYGSNDFHHLALTFIRRFRQPFNLVIFDNHPDWFRHYRGMHCGTWFHYAVSLPTVMQAFHFGGASSEFEDNDIDAHPFEDIRRGKLAVFPCVDTWKMEVWNNVPQTPLRPAWYRPIDEDRVRRLLEPHREVLETYPIYITLDKDVMYRTDNLQNWNSGKMSRSEVLVEMSRGRVLALDVTGDFSPVNLTGCYRHHLHKQQHTDTENKIDPELALPNNQLTNLEILRVLKEAIDPTAPKEAPAASYKPPSPMKQHEVQKFLIDAIVNSDPEKLRVVLQSPGVDPAANESEAIRVASARGNAAAVKILLNDGRADPAAVSNFAVTMASWHGHAAVVSLLLKDHRVDPSTKHNYAIRGAVDGGHLDVVLVLMRDSRVDPSAMFNVCLRTAAEKGNMEMVKLLLQDERVDPTAEDSYAIDEAEKRGFVQIAELLRGEIAKKATSPARLRTASI